MLKDEQQENSTDRVETPLKLNSKEKCTSTDTPLVPVLDTDKKYVSSTDEVIGVYRA